VRFATAFNAFTLIYHDVGCGWLNFTGCGCYGWFVTRLRTFTRCARLLVDLRLLPFVDFGLRVPGCYRWLLHTAVDLVALRFLITLDLGWLHVCRLFAFTVCCVTLPVYPFAHFTLLPVTHLLVCGTRCTLRVYVCAFCVYGCVTFGYVTARTVTTPTHGCCTRVVTLRVYRYTHGYGYARTTGCYRLGSFLRLPICRVRLFIALSRLRRCWILPLRSLRVARLRLRSFALLYVDTYCRTLRLDCGWFRGLVRGLRLLRTRLLFLRICSFAVRFARYHVCTLRTAHLLVYTFTVWLLHLRLPFYRVLRCYTVTRLRC